MIFNVMLGKKFGGLEKVFLDQLAMLPECGIDVRGIARTHGIAATRAAASGLPLSTMRVWSEWDPFTIGQARALVRTYKPTLILCHGRKAHRIFARAVGSAVPIIAQVHKPKFDPNLPSAALIVVAEHRKRKLAASGVAAEKITVVPNAVALPATFKTNYAITGVPRIVGLGRLHTKKGFNVLIDALAILHRRGVKFSCAIAGDGPLRPALTQQITMHGLAGKVELVGWVNDVASFLRSADIFAFPSFQEDFPLAVLDAMASGVPIVASAIDGPLECLTEGDTTLFVPAHDAEKFADALARLLGDQALREKFGRNGRAEAEQKYSFPAVGKNLARMLGMVAAA
jgi:glycosyltransferase involved in cell wall biosynthesis